MKSTLKFTMLICIGMAMVSCVSKKQFTAMKTELEKNLSDCNSNLSDCKSKLASCERDRDSAKAEAKTTAQNSEQQIKDLRAQLDDCKAVRDRQLIQVGELTVLSQGANSNIKETLMQLEKKDKYIGLLQAAKTKADSLNLALAVNLKSVLKDGLDDKDIEVSIDKTVVMINLSDKMLYRSGSAVLSSRANEILAKIAKIIESRPDLEVMVEGHTDNVPISNDCVTDNWDLSVKRATAVVRALQKNHKVSPARMIAAGRGEYNPLTGNSTADGRSTNRRTRIIIMPKLNQFYDLLNPVVLNQE
jgi:chemotaxis protein MotB